MHYTGTAAEVSQYSIQAVPGWPRQEDGIQGVPVQYSGCTGDGRGRRTVSKVSQYSIQSVLPSRKICASFLPSGFR